MVEAETVVVITQKQVRDYADRWRQMHVTRQASLRAFIRLCMAKNDELRQDELLDLNNQLETAIGFAAAAYKAEESCFVQRKLLTNLGLKKRYVDALPLENCAYLAVLSDMATRWSEMTTLINETFPNAMRTETQDLHRSMTEYAALRITDQLAPLHNISEINAQVETHLRDLVQMASLAI